MQANTLKPGSPLIIALDYASESDAIAMARKLDPGQCRVKVGKELFTRAGPAVVESLQKLGFEVFLDLKFHDIPNTTAAAVAAAADMGVWMVNVHASGGRRMMEACTEKLALCKHRPWLIGVTVLTSMQQSDLHELGINKSPMEQVAHLASMTRDAGLDGVVCSSHEVATLKAELGNNFKLVTPGIRPAFSQQDDQRRVMTPREAISAGSDFLVVGRPITQHTDPHWALTQILDEIHKD